MWQPLRVLHRSSDVLRSQMRTIPRSSILQRHASFDATPRSRQYQGGIFIRTHLRTLYGVAAIRSPRYFSSEQSSTQKATTRPWIQDEVPPEIADYGPDRTVYLKICYAEQDIEEGDIVESKFHWESILETTQEMFGCRTDTGNLEYYNGDDWFQLKPFRLYDVLKYYPCTSVKPLPLRIPDLFDEEYGTRNDVVKMKKITPQMRKRQKEIMKMGPNPHNWLLKETIDALAYRMKRDGYFISEHSTLEQPMLTFTYHDVQGQVQTVQEPTRHYILEQARLSPWVRPPREAAPPPRPAGTTPEEEMQMQKQEEQERQNPEKILQHLKYVLLSHPRALRHIEECLHYDFLWAV